MIGETWGDCGVEIRNMHSPARNDIPYMAMCDRREWSHSSVSSTITTCHQTTTATAMSHPILQVREHCIAHHLNLIVQVTWVRMKTIFCANSFLPFSDTCLFRFYFGSCTGDTSRRDWWGDWWEGASTTHWLVAHASMIYLFQLALGVSESFLFIHFICSYLDRSGLLALNPPRHKLSVIFLL